MSKSIRPLFLWTYARYSFIINLLKKKKYKNIVEIWSGPFWISDYYDINFTGIDMMNKKVKGRSKKMKFKIGDACKLEEKDNNYDFVFSTDMLEHIPPSQRIQCIKEAIRICNDTCVIGFPCWKLAQLHDDLLFYYLEWKDKNRKNWRFWWLVEHVENWLPTYDDLSDIKKSIEKMWYNCEEIRYNDIIQWKNIIAREMKFINWWIIWLWLSTILTLFNKIFKKTYYCDDKLWYRVFLVIKKS